MNKKQLAQLELFKNVIVEEVESAQSWLNDPKTDNANLSTAYARLNTTVRIAKKFANITENKNFLTECGINKHK